MFMLIELLLDDLQLVQAFPKLSKTFLIYENRKTAELLNV